MHMLVMAIYMFGWGPGIAPPLALSHALHVGPVPGPRSSPGRVDEGAPALFGLGNKDQVFMPAGLPPVKFAVIASRRSLCE